MELPTKDIKEFNIDEKIVDCVNKSYASSALEIIPKEPNLQQILGDTIFQELVRIFKNENKNNGGNEGEELTDQELARFANTFSATIALRKLEEEKHRKTNNVALNAKTLDDLISSKLQAAASKDLGGLDQYVAPVEIAELMFYMEYSEQHRAARMRKELQKLSNPISSEQIYYFLDHTENSSTDEGANGEQSGTADADNSDAETPHKKTKVEEFNDIIRDNPFKFQPSIVASVAAEGEKSSNDRTYELLIPNRNLSWVKFVNDIYTTKDNKKILLFGGILHLFGQKGFFNQLLNQNIQNKYSISLIYLNKKNKISEKVVSAKDFIIE